MLSMCEGRVFARRNNEYQTRSKRRILASRIGKMNIDFLTMNTYLYDPVGVYGNWQPTGRNLQEWQQKGAAIVVLPYLFGNWQPTGDDFQRVFLFCFFI
jgi:hypothetical protein